MEEPSQQLCSLINTDFGGKVQSELLKPENSRNNSLSILFLVPLVFHTLRTIIFSNCFEVQYTEKLRSRVLYYNMFYQQEQLRVS